MCGRQLIPFFRIVFQIVKQGFGLFRSLGKIIINQFPVAHAIGGEVAAAVCVREVHQERLGTLLVHLTAQLLFQIESVYHVVLGNFASCHRQNSRIDIHDCAQLCLHTSYFNRQVLLYFALLLRLGPSCDERNTHTTFKLRPLFTSQRSGRTIATFISQWSITTVIS